MKINYSVAVGIILVISITFLCRSYIPSGDYPDQCRLESGTYELVARGDTHINLSGSAALEATKAVSRDGVPYTQLKFQLENEGNNRHSLDLYMADPRFGLPLFNGTYRISEHIEGFLKEFSGVIGFADIEQFGELPFFTEQGQITIFNRKKGQISGRMELKLSNTLGKIIEVEGNFVALQED